MADAEDRLYTSAEVEEMVKQHMPVHSPAAKLPHQRTAPPAVSPPEAYPELPEPEDPLTEIGQRIGQEAAGRGGFPLRLRHA